jgi:hypothetical protein
LAIISDFLKHFSLLFSWEFTLFSHLFQLFLFRNNSNIQSRKLRFAYTVLDTASDQVLATGYTEHVCITPAGKVTRIPEKWREMLGQTMAK